MREQLEKLRTQIIKINFNIDSPVPDWMREKQDDPEDQEDAYSPTYDAQKLQDANLVTKLPVLFGKDGYLGKINYLLQCADGSKPEGDELPFDIFPELHEYVAVTKEFCKRFSDPLDLGGLIPADQKKLVKSLERILFLPIHYRELDRLFEEILCLPAKDILSKLKKFEYEISYDNQPLVAHWRIGCESLATNLKEAEMNEKDDPLGLLISPEMKKISYVAYHCTPGSMELTVIPFSSHNMILLLTAEFKKSILNSRFFVSEEMAVSAFQDFIIHGVCTKEDIITQNEAGQFIVKKEFKENLLTYVVVLLKKMGVLPMTALVYEQIKQHYQGAELLEEKDPKYIKLQKQAETLSHTLSVALNLDGLNLRWPKTANPQLGEIIQSAILFHENLKMDLIWSLVVHDRKMTFQLDSKVIRVITNLLEEVLRVVNAALITQCCQLTAAKSMVQKVIDRAKEAYDYKSATPLERLKALKKDYNSLTQFLKVLIVKPVIHQFDWQLKILDGLSPEILNDFLGYALERNAYVYLLYLLEHDLIAHPWKFNLDQFKIKQKELGMEVRLVLNVMKRKFHPFEEKPQSQVFSSLNNILVYICKKGLSRCFEQFFNYESTLMEEPLPAGLIKNDPKIFDFKKYGLLNKEDYQRFPIPKRIPETFQMMAFKENDLSLLHIAASAGHFQIVKSLVCGSVLYDDTRPLLPPFFPHTIAQVLQWMQEELGPVGADQEVISLLKPIAQASNPKIKLIMPPAPKSNPEVKPAPAELKALKKSALYVFNVLIKYDEKYTKEIDQLASNQLFQVMLKKLTPPEDHRLIKQHLASKIEAKALAKHRGYLYWSGNSFFLKETQQFRNLTDLALLVRAALRNDSVISLLPQPLIANIFAFIIDPHFFSLITLKQQELLTKKVVDKVSKNSNQQNIFQSSGLYLLFDANRIQNPQQGPTHATPRY